MKTDLPLPGAKPGKVAGTLRRAVHFSRQNATVRPKGWYLETEEP